ncbi:hypothetical protein [Yoonia sp. BS5-3]|uniref:Uncharacterized protein n=1 Tax=Yoonia phaeophyticola TaxID=3137369 RepID=A0ABZ2V5Q0_9RHOB
MTDVAGFPSKLQMDAPKTATVKLPAPVPFSAPVLVSDCATPIAGETVLKLLWNRLDCKSDDD